MTPLERKLASFATRVESVLSEKLQNKREPETIDPFVGYATPDEVVVLGRVMSVLVSQNAKFGQSRLTNFRQMLQRFITSEVGGAQVSAREHVAVSDEEGYFKLTLPRDGRVGWVTIDVTLVANGSTTPCPVFIADPNAPVMVISDIDDTVMKTGAYSLARNLWTSFTGNTLTRQVYADAAVLLHRLAETRGTPVYYVSSSPWNLHSFLQTVFERSSAIKGPMFLRDLGLSETKLITNGHGNHKGDAITTIMAANPSTDAILLGDTGQKDAEVYLKAIQDHPGRIRAVVLREPGPGPNRATLNRMKQIEKSGVPVFSGPSFAPFSDEVVGVAAAPRPVEQTPVRSA